ncbi:unnamed protein product [Bursaphelenchus xylophilus]|uniref:(pine wood nematode) hypothetical protein n=1 Tax=Bursaphelenchus xylophilus TaxID=6326 RepID=A0A1I7RSD9_BURXY|nr:unnamed protein product [Bursaphelenchus xylophilus]CAG9123021.1 unnamed protein product [Bursaphelenchus xylophilus]
MSSFGINMGFITTGDLQEALLDIGYEVSADDLDLLTREVLNNIGNEENIFDNGLVDLTEEDAPFCKDLNDTLMENSVVYEQTKPEYLNEAEKIIKESYECVKRCYSHMLEITEGGSHVNDRFVDLHKKISDMRSLLRERSAVDEQESCHEVDGHSPKEISENPINKYTERMMINRFLKDNCLRPVICPEPGRLPFRQDRIRTLDNYKREWAQRPPPGENKRLALRWKIREALIKRDIPVIKLTDTTDHAYMPEKPQWQ